MKWILSGQIVGLPMRTLFKPRTPVYIPESIIDPFYHQADGPNQLIDYESTSIMCEKFKHLFEKQPKYSFEMRSKRHEQAKKKRARRREGKKIQLK